MGETKYDNEWYYNLCDEAYEELRLYYEDDYALASAAIDLAMKRYDERETEQ